MTNGKNEVLMAVRSGKAIRFNEEKVRPMGRAAAGVIGIDCDSDNDEVIGMICVDKSDDETQSILVVSEKDTASALTLMNTGLPTGELKE
jgi:DNA gyrase subunit A